MRSKVESMAGSVEDVMTRLMHVEATFDGPTLAQVLDAVQNAAKAQQDRAADIQGVGSRQEHDGADADCARRCAGAAPSGGARGGEDSDAGDGIEEIRHDVDMHVIQTAFLEQARRSDLDEGVDDGEVTVSSQAEELRHPALAFLTDREIGRARCTSRPVSVATAWVFERAPVVEDACHAVDECPRKEVRFDLTADDSSSASGESASHTQSCGVAEDLRRMGYPFTFR